MLQERAIVETKEKNLVVSSIYTVPKRDSEARRPVINLRWLNDHVRADHFRMSTMKDVKAAVTKNCWI